LIEANCSSNGFSASKTAKIVALVESTLKMGVPEQQDLQDRLEDIGRAD